MTRLRLPSSPDLIRNLIFGLEDGFVSTTGVLFGIATATPKSSFILVAGLITVLVEATSMGAGAYLSEKSSQEISSWQKPGGTRSYIDGLVMFGTYVVAGTICVIPYALFAPGPAKVISVPITLSCLFLVGYLPQRKWQRGVEVFFLGGIAVLIGYLAGEFFRNLNVDSFSS